MTFESPQEVICDLEKSLTDDEEYDVIIYAGENENVKEIHAHSFILRTRSQYFRTAFSNKLYEKKDERFIFKKPHISPYLFEIILRFIYCGKVDLTKLQGPDALKLLMLMDEINIPTLIHHVQEYLIKHRYEFLQQSPIKILEIVYRYETFTELRNFCLEKVCTEPDILFKSNKFISLKAPLLELFLKRDDLSLDEIVVWESLIKWCFAQHDANISQDPTQWDKEEIVIMERTIHRFIPLIRFHYISSKDFVTKVYPFKEIIPKDLISNILMFRMAPDEKLNTDMQPPRKSINNIDSTIINQKHVTIFTNWIDRKSCKFKLLYRASRDGNTAAAFHKQCDNKGATIVIIKIKNSEQIVGGYNPLNWDSNNKYKLAYDNFIFSFTDRNNLFSARIGYNYYDTIGCHSSFGPKFGDDKNGLNFLGDTWYMYGNYSPNVDIPGSFKADDYEVFQVTRK
ncbi:hypothetical protein RclHR1_07360006 [Rhizophagus clarus]|uniref:BTB domain-containing protein n=1 Tax=Rhizophagus clarus TaxID=94130 RepID=A0A2Z6S2T5_9GLOM|nr:hypothetical protein RclHR1_07360006 [Rhizophagus clarus]GES85068.1 hypothetical protein GLOIN_2v1474815 [Rhizophagus clarus]